MQRVDRLQDRNGNSAIDFFSQVFIKKETIAKLLLSLYIYMYFLCLYAELSIAQIINFNIPILYVSEY